MLRRKQRLALGEVLEDGWVGVESGCLMLEAVLENGRHQVMLFLYPGDAIMGGAWPPLSRTGLTALIPASLVKHRNQTPSTERPAGFLQADPAAATARLVARAALHGVALASLAAEARFATLLTEMALNLDCRLGPGHALEVPLWRAEMAGYLGLNPDTLSRLMSSFRARQLIAMTTRGSAKIRDFEALAALTPLAGALRTMKAKSAPSFAETAS